MMSKSLAIGTRVVVTPPTYGVDGWTGMEGTVESELTKGDFNYLVALETSDGRYAGEVWLHQCRVVAVG